MKWTIPGTVLPADVSGAENIEEKFSAMFFGGGMVLSQVAAVTGLEPYTVQNWVKRGFLTKPIGKKYTLRQLCRIININMLKSALPMEEICRLISYVNGQLDDESDDLIDDSRLYFLFIRLAAKQGSLHNFESLDACLTEVLADYQEPVPGARERVKQVLKVMLTAWGAGMLRQQACSMAARLKTGGNG